MVDTNYKLILEMEKAEQALMVHADSLITKEVLNACINIVEKGIALELFLDMENKFFLEENDFLLNKCIQLVNKGGSIFLVPNITALKFWQCVADFKTYSYYSIEKEEVLYKEETDNPAFQNVLQDFEKKKQDNKPYLVEKGDIEIRMTLSDRLIMMGDTVDLNWEVDGADKIIVQGLGRVDAYGRKKIRLERNTILKIGASNERQSKIKAVLVRVSDDLVINYDIGFISAGTKKYNSLVNSDIHPHVYGISEGNQVKLSWEVPLAAEVTIMPFNIKGAKGEYIFTPSDSFNIEILATIKSRVFSRKIQLLIFPIPLFKEKLVTVAQQLSDKKYELTIPVLLKEKVENFRTTEQKRYRDLNSKISDQGISIGSRVLDLNKINNSFFNILKDKYSHRKGIFNAIQSIQSYYGKTQSGDGTEESSL